MPDFALLPISLRARWFLHFSCLGSELLGFKGCGGVGNLYNFSILLNGFDSMLMAVFMGIYWLKCCFWFCIFSLEVVAFELRFFCVAVLEFIGFAFVFSVLLSLDMFPRSILGSAVVSQCCHFLLCVVETGRYWEMGSIAVGVWCIQVQFN